MSKPVATDGTVYIYFPSIDSSGNPVAPSSAFTASDFAIHKDGSATEKATTNGITVTSPFDSETGLHLLAIDTSNDTGDSGFWEDWASYSVRFNTAKTIDSRSIDGRPVPRGEFYIDPTYGTNKRDFVDAPNSTAITAIQDGLATAANQGIPSTGANSVTITVDDGSDPLEGATVRVTQGAEDYRLTTDANGEVDFSLDDATWTVRITKPGYTFTATTLVVDGDETQTYSMTAVSATAPDAPFINAVLQCYETDSTPKANAEVTVTVLSLPESGGYAVQSGPYTITADANGLIDDFEVIPGATYSLQYDDSNQSQRVLIPSDAIEGHELKPIYG